MRADNWPQILADALNEVRETDFEWGKTDCLYWTNNVVEKMTGRNPIADYCHKLGISEIEQHYKSSKGFKRLLKKHKIKSFYDMVCNIYGQPIRATFAQRGDLVMLDMEETEQRHTLGICRGQDVVFKSLESTFLVPLSSCSWAWRIN